MCDFFKNKNKICSINNKNLNEKKEEHVCSSEKCCCCKHISLYDPSGENMVFSIWDIEEKKKKWICGKCFQILSKNKNEFKRFIYL